MATTSTVALYFAVGLTFGLVLSFLVTNFSAGVFQYQPKPYTLRSGAEHEVVRALLADLKLNLTKEVNATHLEINKNKDSHSHEGHGHDHDDLDRLDHLNTKVEFHDEHFHHDDDRVSKELFKKVRVLCWVMTGPQNLETKARVVKNTWGKRCNILLFMSSEENKEFPTIGLKVQEGREHLTAKTMQAFKYCYDNYYNQADWFLKADDDTYVVVENLRYMLKDKNTSDPVYFGHHFQTIVKQGYFSGGAGYVLSREALRRMVTQGLGHACRADGGAEDAEIGHCMEALGVRTGDSRDALGRSRFHCFNPETHLMGGYPDWYYQYDKYGAKKGAGNISDYAVTFHYVHPHLMYALEFFIYHLRPYGIESHSQELNKKVPLIGKEKPLIRPHRT